MRTLMTATLAAIALAAACTKAAPERDAGSRADGGARGEMLAKAAVVDRAAAAPPAQSAGFAANEAAPGEPVRAPGAWTAADSLAPSMIIRTGTASIEVDSLEPAVAHVRDLARRVGGFVANVQMQAGRNQTRSATLEIRLPSARFDDVATGLQPVGRVESVNVSAEDVGEEYVDVAARVANAHRLEQRLIDVLNTKTGKLKDVLDVERELARVREEIERMEGRMRYLRTRASVSTFSITVHEPYPVVGERGSTSVLGGAFKQSWRNFIGFTARLIAALGTVIPTVLLLALAAWAAVTLVRRMIRPAKTE